MLALSAMRLYLVVPVELAENTMASPPGIPIGGLRTGLLQVPTGSALKIHPDAARKLFTAFHYLSSFSLVQVYLNAGIALLARFLIFVFHKLILSDGREWQMTGEEPVTARWSFIGSATLILGGSLLLWGSLYAVLKALF
jgi:hypothetical protein